MSRLLWVCCRVWYGLGIVNFLLACFELYYLGKPMWALYELVMSVFMIWLGKKSLTN